MMRSQNLIGIQALRAIAAMAVAVCHFEQMTLMLFGITPPEPSTYFLQAGVDLFFVISGFVMLHASWDAFGQSGEPREFMVRRLVRIVPLFWATMAVAILFETVPPGLSEVVQSYLFLPYRDPNGSYSPIYGVGWTLNYEMFFYALFAVALLFPRRIGLTGLLCCLVGLAVFGCVVRPMAFAPLAVWSNPIILEFAAGMLLAVAFRSGVRISGRLAAILVVGAAACIVLFAKFAPSPPPALTLRPLVWGLPCVVFVAAATLGLRFNAPRLLSRAINAAGEASYSLYLIHPLVVALIMVLRGKGYISGDVMPQAVAGFAITVILALSVSSFERPLRDKLQRRLTRRREPVLSIGDTLVEVNR